MTPPAAPDSHSPGSLKLAGSPRPFVSVNAPLKLPASASPPAGPVRTNPAEPVGSSVTAILCDQRRREAALGLDELAPSPPRSNRRTQDYWIMLAGGNALIGAAMALGQFNAVSLVYGGSAAVLYSLGLTWIVWVVMDRY